MKNSDNILDKLLEGDPVSLDEASESLNRKQFNSLTAGINSNQSLVSIDEENNLIEQEIGRGYKVKKGMEPRTMGQVSRKKACTLIPSLSSFGIDKEKAAVIEVLGGAAGTFLLTVNPIAAGAITVSGITSGLKDFREEMFLQRAEDVLDNYSGYDLKLYTDQDRFVSVYHATDSLEKAEDVIRKGRIERSEPGPVRSRIGVTPVVYANKKSEEMKFYLGEKEGVVFEIDIHESRLGYGAHSFTVSEPLSMNEVTKVYPEENIKYAEELLQEEGYEGIEVERWQ